MPLSRVRPRLLAESEFVNAVATKISGAAVNPDPMPIQTCLCKTGAHER
jgi:hypothetical protein